MTNRRRTTLQRLALPLLGAALAMGPLACSQRVSEEVHGGTAGKQSSSNEGRGYSLFGRKDEVTVPAGTTVTVQLSEELDSGSANEGAPVRGTVVSPVTIGGAVVVPAGARVLGEVDEVKPAKHFGGQATVAVRWNEIELPSGDRLKVEGRMAATAKKQTGKDAAIIAGSAVGGALLGDAVGGEDGDVAGAVIGGGAGTAVAARRGKEAVLPAGRSVTVRVSGSQDVEADS